MVAAAGLLPIAVYLLLIGRVPAVSPVQAREALVAETPRAVLVDVRPQKAYAQFHIQGSLNWPLEEILAVTAPDQIPAIIKGRKIILLCEAGLSSARGVAALEKVTGQPVTHVRGGIQQWPKGASGISGPFLSFVDVSGTVSRIPVKPASFFEQIAACAAAFFIKPVYMLLSLALIVMLRRYAAPDLAALRFAMICFLAGEGFCAVNYLFYGESSYIVEYLHIIGMVFAFGLSVYAAVLSMDVRVLGIGEVEKRCAALPLCRGCMKHGEDSCAFFHLMAIAAGAVSALCFLPMVADIQLASYNTDIFGTVYTYTHPAVFQIFEIRFAPAAGLLFAGIALFMLRKPDYARGYAGIFFMSAGAGFLGFALFRLIIFQVFRDNMLWYIVWEEMTELIYVLSIVALLGYFYKRSRKTRAPVV